MEDRPLHEQLRDVRLDRKLTQSELAQLLGENVHWVSKREIGETRLTHDDVVRLVNALEVPDDTLLRLYGRGVE